MKEHDLMNYRWGAVLDKDTRREKNINNHYFLSVTADSVQGERF